MLGSALAARCDAAEPALELRGATFGADFALLAGIERVRGRGDIELDERVGVAIFPFDGFRRAHGRANLEVVVDAGVVEDDLTIVRMDACFHEILLLIDSVMLLHNI